MTTPSQSSFTGMSTEHNGFDNQAERAKRSSRKQIRAGNQGERGGRTTIICPWMRSYVA
jgi:hypothetical protein